MATVPSNYILSNGFWYAPDGSGPFFFNSFGTAIALGGGTGGGTGGDGGSPSQGALYAFTGGTGTSGAPQVGDALTVTMTDGVQALIQIQRVTFDGTGAVASIVDIPGASTSTAGKTLQYTVTGADAGCVLRPKVSGLLFVGAELSVPGGTDLTAPTRLALYITADEPDAIVILYSEPLASPAPAGSAFTLTGTITTPKSAPVVTTVGSMTKLKYATAFVGADQPILTYAIPGSNPIRDTSGNAAPAINAIYVANQMELPPVYVEPAGTGNEQWPTVVDGNYYSTYDNPGVNPRFMANVRAVGGDAFADEDCYIEFQAKDTTPILRRVSMQRWQSNILGCPAMDFASGTLSAVTSDTEGYAPATVASMPFGNTDGSHWCRLRRTVDGGVMTIEVSTDNRVSWSAFYTFSYVFETRAEMWVWVTPQNTLDASDIPMWQLRCYGYGGQ